MIGRLFLHRVSHDSSVTTDCHHLAIFMTGATRSSSNLFSRHTQVAMSDFLFSWALDMYRYMQSQQVELQTEKNGAWSWPDDGSGRVRN